MSPGDIIIRRSTVTDYPEMMRFIDGIFFPKTPGGFRVELPNLYCDPGVATREAFLACERDRIIGHVGVYPLRLRAGSGLELAVGGIGAVATDPRYRGRGVMASLLQTAIEAMQAASCDLSVLWGDRKRYHHFGWESVGRKMEWHYDVRIALAAGATPVPLIAFDASQHLEALVQSWNSDTAGTLHDSESLRALTTRTQWRIAIAADAPRNGSLPFVMYQSSPEHIVVDKLVGDPDILPGMLLSLCERHDTKPPILKVHCPALPHPVARLGIKMNSALTVRPACQARVINAQRLTAKLQIEPHLPADLCEAARMLFGTPADAGRQFHPLWIEEPARV